MDLPNLAHSIVIEALSASPVGVLITDIDGYIVWHNPAIERLTGYSSAELTNSNVNMLKSGEHDAAFYTDIWQTLGHGRTWKGNIINRRKDGTTYHEAQTIAPVPNLDGGPTYFIAYKEDVTHLVTLENERQAHLEQLTSSARQLHGLNRMFQENLAAKSALISRLREAIPEVNTSITHLTMKVSEVEKAWTEAANADEALDEVTRLPLPEIPLQPNTKPANE